MMFQGEKPTGEETLASQFQKTYDKGILDLGASTESATKMLTDVGNGFSQLLSDANASIINIDKAMQGLINQMGRGQNLSDGIRRNLAEAVPGVIEMGGKLQDVADIAGEYTATLGRNVTLTSNQIEELFAAEKITNLQSNELIAAFSNVGMSVKDISVTMLKVREVANNLGANAIATSTEVVKNLDKLNRYGFSNGVEGLARMAAQSKTLRTDMSKVFALADDIMDPDRAIALASSLQRLGASSEALTNPLRLMDLAQNNVPQLQTELGKMFKQFTKFNEETGQFQINKGARLQIKAIADEMGIGIAEAEKYGLSFADLSKKMSEISFSAVDIDEDTKTLVANMASIGAGGEYFIKDESGKDVKLQEFLTSYQGREEDLKKFLEVQQAEEGKSYEQKMLDAQEDIAKVARMQLDAYTKTTQLGLAAEAAMPMAVAGSEFAQQMLAVNTDLSEKIYRPIIDNLGPKSDTVQAFNKAGKGLEEVVEELKKENPDFDKILTKVETTVAEVGVELAGAVGKTIKDISAPLGGLLKEMGVDIDLIIDALGVKVNKIITDIQTKYPSIESSVLEGLNKYKEQFENMLDELEIEKQIESLIEKVKTATPTDMTQLMQMYETLKNSIPPDMVTGVQDVMTKLEEALRGGGVTLPPTIPPTGGGGVNLPPTIPNNIQVPPTIPNNIQLPPTIPNNIQLPPTIQIQSSPSLNQQPITNVGPANTNVLDFNQAINGLTTTLNAQNTTSNNLTNSLASQTATLIPFGQAISGIQPMETEGLLSLNYEDLKKQLETLNQTMFNVGVNTQPSTTNTTNNAQTLLQNFNDTFIQSVDSQLSQIVSEDKSEVIIQSLTDVVNKQIQDFNTSSTNINQEISNFSESVFKQTKDILDANNVTNFNFSELSSSLVTNQQNNNLPNTTTLGNQTNNSLSQLNQTISNQTQSVTNANDLNNKNFTQVTQNIENQSQAVTNASNLSNENFSQLNQAVNTNVSKEETLKLNTTSTLDGMTEALKYYSASPSLQVTIVGDKTKEINTVEGKNLSELEQTINNQNQTVTNSMIATTQDLNNLNDTIQNTTSQSSLFANESSNSVTEFFNQQTRQQSESNNFANQSINNLSESIGDQFQQVVNQNNTNNQVSTNLNNGVGVTVAEIPAPQISNQTILTPSPAAINPLEIPKAENLLQNGIMTYGGEVKISHELEIKVSSTDGKLKGDEIGKLLTAELKKDNKLVNDIKNQIGSNASFGVTSSPKAISEPQFGK